MLQAIFQCIAIIIVCVLGAIAYGIVHDQITARICVEYFTIGHVRIIDSVDPTLLGLLWGVIATWWFGLILGIPLGLVSVVGSKRIFTAFEIIKPLAITLGFVGVLAATSGAVGYVSATQHWVWLDEPMATMVPKEKHVAFLTDLWTHLASYLGGFLGGVGLCIYVSKKRKHDNIHV